MNKPGDSFGTLGRHYKPISFPNRAARHSRATLCHFFVAGESALIPSRISSETPSAPLGDITSLYRPTTEPRDTLGRRYSPKVFHNRAMRHSRATLQPLNVPQQFCATPLGNALPLFRRRNVRINPLSNKPGDSFGTLGRRFKPTSFPNRAARHSRATYSPKTFPNRAVRYPWATLKPRNVPQQFCAAPSGDVTAPKRSPTGLRGTLGQHFATFSSLESSH